MISSVITIFLFCSYSYNRIEILGYNVIFYVFFMYDLYFYRHFKLLTVLVMLLCFFKDIFLVIEHGSRCFRLNICGTAALLST